MNKHTPGPWYVAKTGNHQGLLISEPDGCNVAVTYRKEDAPLIAAMPDWLAALREIAERGPVPGYDSVSALQLRLVATQSIARDALAKATDH